MWQANGNEAEKGGQVDGECSSMQTYIYIYIYNIYILVYIYIYTNTNKAINFVAITFVHTSSKLGSAVSVVVK